MSTTSAIGNGLDWRNHQLSSSIVPLTANSVATSAGGALAWGDVRFAVISRKMRNREEGRGGEAGDGNRTVQQGGREQKSLNSPSEQSWSPATTMTYSRRTTRATKERRERS